MKDENEKTMQNQEFWDKLEKDLPPILTRDVAAQKLAGLISARTLANRDSQGTGPGQTIKLGRRVAYDRKTLVDWLKRETEARPDEAE